MTQNVNYRTALLAFSLIFAFQAQSQKIDLIELQNFSLKGPETANAMLLTNGWEFIEAKRNTAFSTIVRWEFTPAGTKEVTNLLELSTFEKEPNSVRYQFNQKDYYLTIMSKFSANGYKLITDNIANQVVSATYEAPGFILILNYKRTTANGKDATIYEISLTPKTESLVAKSASTNSMDKQKEFDEDGNLLSEFYLKNGKREGAIIYFFPDGTVKREALLKEGVENGLAAQYDYDSNSNDLLYKTTGTMVDGKQEGVWLKNKISKNSLNPIELITYENGLKQGDFQSIRNDSLILMRYKNDKIEGHFRIFLHKKADLKITDIDTTKMSRIVHGFYVEDKKIGLWKYFDASESLTEEGYLLNDDKTGVWKYYYPSSVVDTSIPKGYSGKLYLEETYRNAKQNGSCIRYSMLKKEKKPCNNAADKDCYTYIFEDFLEKSTLSNGILNGSYEMTNADNEIFAKGDYSNGKPTGKWTLLNESRLAKRTNKTKETGFFQAGIKDGNWERSDSKNQLLESYSYKNGVLDGDYFLHENNIPAVKWHFDNGIFTEYAMLDVDKNPITAYVLSDISEDGYFCQKTEKNPDGICVKTFKVKSAAPKEEHLFTFKNDFETMSGNVLALSGLYVLKNKENNIVEEGHYAENQKTGKWTNFYYDQKVRTTFIYENGTVMAEDYFDLKKNEPFSGEFVYKEKNADTTEERKVKDGLRHGTTRFRDARDKTIKKESYKKGVLQD